jgi:lincosamide nucleotidyltransferase A/C/D/E
MSQADVLEVLDRLDGSAIRVWLDGGWGVDALLGEVTRRHADLDLVISLDDVAVFAERMAAHGYQHVRGGLDSNFVLRDARGSEIDVHPVRFDADGDGVYRMENGEDWVFPADGFLGIGRVGARRVHCLSADVQMVDHATGYEPGPTDLADMRLLHERLGTRLLPPYDVLSAPPTGRDA